MKSLKNIIAISLLILSVAFFLFYKINNNPTEASLRIYKCNGISNEGEKKICLRNILENTVKKEGISDGLVLFKEMAVLYPNDCHGYAHDLGAYAFDIFKQTKKVNIGTEASYCGYGFWHGFMQKMSANSRLEEAKGFCDSQKGTTPELSSIMRSSCAHGIGIGLIPEPPPIKLWGNTQALIKPALKYCDTLDAKYNMIDNCQTGVFHAMVDLVTERRFKFDFNKDDPMALCFLQEEKYRPECFYQIAPRLPKITQNNLPKVFEIVRQISEKTVYERTLEIALINFTDQRMTVGGRMNFFKKCKSEDYRVAGICVSSMVLSIFNTGIPGEEYVTALDLCSSSEFSDKEKETCYNKTVASSRSNYEDKKVQGICKSIEQKYKKICKD